MNDSKNYNVVAAIGSDDGDNDTKNNDSNKNDDNDNSDNDNEIMISI